MIDILNSIVVLANYVIIPAITYGSQLALGALGVTLIYPLSYQSSTERWAVLWLLSVELRMIQCRLPALVFFVQVFKNLPTLTEQLAFCRFISPRWNHPKFRTI